MYFVLGPYLRKWREQVRQVRQIAPSKECGGHAQIRPRMKLVSQSGGFDPGLARFRRTYWAWSVAMMSRYRLVLFRRSDGDWQTDSFQSGQRAFCFVCIQNTCYVCKQMAGRS